MKKILALVAFAFTVQLSAQITPAIVGNTISSATVVSATTSFSGSQLNLNNTLTINAGVDFTINCDLNPNASGKLICLGNNKITIVGSLNGTSPRIEMYGNVCIYFTGNYAAPSSASYITASGENNFITCGGNINSTQTSNGVITNLPTTICVQGNTSNPCSNTPSITCSNQCDSDQNSAATYKTQNATTGWKDNGGNNTTMTSTKRAIVALNFAVSSGSSFSCCSLTVNAGKTLTINSGAVVTVYNQIINNGTIIVESGGSLVQKNDGVGLTGNDITVKRTTPSVQLYDYIYWSAPTKSATLAATTNGSSTMYYSFDGVTQDWATASSGTSMAAGTGYISMVPSASVYTASFVGKPNNGAIKTNIVRNALGFNNLIGNPYPSAIDAKLFIQGNSGSIQGANGNPAITGTLYFWTHKTAYANNVYTANDYASWNLVGGVGVGAAPASDPLNNALKPNGYIGSGQGFFVEASAGNGTKVVTFTNSMRVSSNSSNGQFFRSAQNQTDDEPTVSESENDPAAGLNAHRLWLNLTNAEGAFSQTLLGYIDGATDQLDWGYDGNALDAGNYVGLYSVLDENRLVIQGRSVDFQQEDVVPLGFTTSIAGAFEISIDHVDGLFDGDQPVYLVDKANNDFYFNLKDGAYAFTTESGTFNDRFELRYTNAALGVDVPATSALYAIGLNGKFEIVSQSKEIESVALYDLLGRFVYSSKDIQSSSFQSPDLGLHDQVVIVKIVMADGTEMTRKLILK